MQKVKGVAVDSGPSGRSLPLVFMHSTQEMSMMHCTNLNSLIVLQSIMQMWYVTESPNAQEKKIYARVMYCAWKCQFIAAPAR